MATTDLAGLPTPEETDDPDVPADLKLLADAIDPRLNLLATDEADRNTKYSAAPPGTLVSSPSGWQWIKLNDGTWYTVSSYETTTAIAWEPVVTDNGSKMTRVNGRLISLEVNVTYVGADITANSAGNFANVRMATLPTGWRVVGAYQPLPTLLNASTTLHSYTNPFGDLNLIDAHPGQTITSGDSLYIRTTWVI